MLHREDQRSYAEQILRIVYQENVVFVKQVPEKNLVNWWQQIMRVGTSNKFMLAKKRGWSPM